MITFDELTPIGLFCTGCLLSTILLIWGGVRWLRLPKQKSITAVLSLLGFIFATAAALTGVSAAVYSFAIGSFPSFPIDVPHVIDELMEVAYLLSLGGLLLSLGGIWKANSLRWHAPVSALTTYAFLLAAVVAAF